MVVQLNKLTAEGHDGLRSCLLELQRSNRHYSGGIFVLFTGAKVADTGRSWCPSCVRAEPVIEQALDDLAKVDTDQQQLHIVFITCDIGNREVWKSPSNSIKADATLDVKSVPSLIKYSLSDGCCVQGQKLDTDEQFRTVDSIVEFILKRP
uniref:Thioredoxin domain-containing protein 17 n=1 Tax=Globodera pallida TaxID=36090 RepID=A0A183CAC3_GLOPA